jgi:hypothetical protein
MKTCDPKRDLACGWLSAGTRFLLDLPVARRHATLQLRLHQTHPAQASPAPATRKDISRALHIWKALSEHSPPRSRGIHWPA